MFHLAKYAGIIPHLRDQVCRVFNPANCLINNPVVNYLKIISEATAAAGTAVNFRDLILTSDRSRGRVTHKSHIFTDVYALPPYAHVTDQAKRSRDIDNAGGKSDVSEMYSIDYLMRIHDAHSIIFETEVQYWITYKMVDFICTIDDQRVGVSVARAMEVPVRRSRRRRSRPHFDSFNSEAAAHLLHKKLYGLIVARNAVSEHQSFYRSILHIWCQSQNIADLMQTAFSNLDNDDYGLDVKGVVILQLTVCADPQLYRNRII